MRAYNIRMADDALSPDDLDVLEQAEQLKLQGEHEEAIALLERLLQQDPENVPALEEVADNELSLEHFDRADTAAKRALALDAQSYTAHYILGYVLSHYERWAEALMHLKEANRLKANNPEILRCLGWALFQGGQRPQGVVTLERALNLDRESVLTLCDLGVVHLHMQNFRKARALFQRTLDLEPENARAKECMELVTRLESQAGA